VRFRSAARRLGEDEMGANGSVAGGARRLEAGLAVCLRFCVIAALVLPAAVLAQPVPAPAQDLPFDDRPPDRWVFAVTPYLWALSLKGGFGVGSDFAWQATGLIGYRVGLFAERDANLFAGYRALDQDYSDGSGRNRFAWDVTAHGPVIGVAIRF